MIQSHQIINHKDLKHIHLHKVIL